MNVSSKPSKRKTQQETASSFSPARKAVHELVVSSRFDLAVGFFIGINFCIIVVEANINADCGSERCIPLWMIVFNYVFLALYTLEAGLKIFAWRTEYFRTPWDVFDFGIVLIGYTDLVLTEISDDGPGLPGMQMLRLFRVARLMRATRIFRIFPELNSMVRGFMSAMSAMWWGFIMILMLLVMWSVVSVEFFNDVNKSLQADDDVCHSAFSSVGNAMLFFFQTLMAGDSWGLCTIPLLRAAPESMIVFAGAFLTIQLGFTNLILAVIVERASVAQAADEEMVMMEEKRRKQEAETHLRDICHQIDSDSDGRITLDDFMDAYESSEDLRHTFTLLDIDREDLECLFHLMDVDNSGDLTYEELVNCIHKSDQNDLKRQMMMIKLQVEDLWFRVRDHIGDSIDQIKRQVNSLAPEKERVSEIQRQGTLTSLSHHRLGRAKFDSNSSSISSVSLTKTKQQAKTCSDEPGCSEIGSELLNCGSQWSEAGMGMGSQKPARREAKQAGDVQRHTKSFQCQLPPKDCDMGASFDADLERFRRRLDEALRAFSNSVGLKTQQLRQAHGSPNGHWDDAQVCWGVRQIQEPQLTSSPRPEAIPTAPKLLQGDPLSPPH